MDKKLKSIVDKTIELQFQHVEQQNLKGMKDLKEYEERSERIIGAWKKLCAAIPEDMQDLLDEYEVLETQQLCSEIRHYFKEVVKAGIGDLRFLEETGQEIHYL